VQNQPGAHVVLQRNDRTRPPEEDLVAAASLAALHSKAKNSVKVTVDYTQRKHVRKRPGAAPGLVFYTHPKSLYVAPAVGANVRQL
jgi:predicted ribosome quality control (RQC) complex YloA/Tae2 family protein